MFLCHFRNISRNIFTGPEFFKRRNRCACGCLVISIDTNSALLEFLRCSFANMYRAENDIGTKEFQNGKLRTSRINFLSLSSGYLICSGYY